MTLLVTAGHAQYDQDWSLIEAYAEDNGVEPVEVLLYPIERSPMGQVIVTYSDSAIAIFTGDSFQNLKDYLSELDGWPMPEVFTRPLPAIAARCAYVTPPPAPEPRRRTHTLTQEDKEPTSVPPQPTRSRRTGVAKQHTHTEKREVHVSARSRRTRSSG